MAHLQILSALLLLLHADALLLHMPSRRDAFQIGAAAVFIPSSPAFAKSKASLNPNKQEGTGANARDYQRQQYAQERLAMNGDKGSRGVASAEFEASDTVVRNRKLNGGLARGPDGRKIEVANRNRSPEELGLKQWNGY
ncbi:hypothetical protein AB1Y20_001042 [Prymnesium parvum]|uniref:Uncharacterized protein n=1 Tax=Prymnesium parvum TaxID=97485 RepID=A0AB34KC74_PRYPA